MSVTIGEVTTFPNVQADKQQVLKIAEEYSEIYSAWENLEEIKQMRKFNNATWGQVQLYQRLLVDECADCITAIANLLAALGVDDNQMQRAIQDCEQRNRDRGRL